MKKTLYNEEQIIGAIKEHEAGAKVDDLCRKLGISSGTVYYWRTNIRWPGSEALAWNNTLKKLLADKLLEVKTMKDVLSKKW